MRRAPAPPCESISTRLAAIDEQLPVADPLSRVHLVQERIDLEQELAAASGDADELEDLGAGFIEVAPPIASERA